MRPLRPPAPVCGSVSLESTEPLVCSLKNGTPPLAAQAARQPRRPGFEASGLLPEASRIGAAAAGKRRKRRVKGAQIPVLARAWLGRHGRIARRGSTEHGDFLRGLYPPFLREHVWQFPLIDDVFSVSTGEPARGRTACFSCGVYNTHHAQCRLDRQTGKSGLDAARGQRVAPRIYAPGQERTPERASPEKRPWHRTRSQDTQASGIEMT